MKTEEQKRLDEARKGTQPWRKWGPYLSERQWGTVREDYSKQGDAWEYFPHDHARSRAYRWGEDGIAGISDDKQKLCFALSLWNGVDSILKERLFGLTGTEGNHGEDVKEYAFYLDNTPTHSYMKYLYKYPQLKFPYEDLITKNRERTRNDLEYELLDTGIFEDNRYYDVFVEYAKASPEDILIKISISNRGPETASLHLLPTLWLRNTWSWTPGSGKPHLSMDEGKIKVSEPSLGTYWLSFDTPQGVLFTENESNNERLFNSPNSSPYVKDAFHNYLIHQKKESINPLQEGTKAAVHYLLEIKGGATAVVQLRLNKQKDLPVSKGFDFAVAKRKKEADAFYKKITPFSMPEDMKLVQRQAFSGLLWNKQYYHYNVDQWIKGDPGMPPPPEERKQGRNHEWKTLNASDIFSMPDKWEYPWFAAWDLAFHAVALAPIDSEFAKQQMLLLVKEWYMHPNGEIPAYEWNFGDVNPPVHAWATMRIYQIETKLTGRKDRVFLEQMFQKLTLNFTWWVNRKDEGNRNIFEGGFLGLDNIGIFNRTKGPPSGGVLYQADGTGWMGMYALNLLQIALELALEDSVYEEMATKFFEHFIYIADAINNIGEEGSDSLWDEATGFYHGFIAMPDGSRIKMPGETLVGMIPIYAVATSDMQMLHAFSGYRNRFQWFIDSRPDLVNKIVQLKDSSIDSPILLSLVSPDKLRRMLEKLLDEHHFLSPYGIRSVSKALQEHPISLELGGKEYTLDYEPAESTTSLFGGNSNWRGPIWFPLNYLLIESLQKFHYFLGADFKVECPTGSGNFLSLWEVSSELSFRLTKIFLQDENKKRPVYGGIKQFQNDPYWRDYILFHEYFQGDNGAGLGASNQTGWTAIVAKLIQQYSQYTFEHQTPEEIEKNKLGNL